MFWDWLLFNRRIQQLEDSVSRLRFELSQLRKTVRTNHLVPSLPTFNLEREMADKLTYRVNLVPVPEDSDIVQQVLAVTVGDTVTTLPPVLADVTSTEIVVDQDSQVDLSLTYIDDAGNVSQARTFSFVATDTLPPAVPGEFSVTLVSESSV
jgi:hypothetical protein